MTRCARFLDQPQRLGRKSILNTARSGFFSSDRTIREYGEEIRQVQPIPVASPDEPPAVQ